jgi:hypothetical protein
VCVCKNCHVTKHVRNFPPNRHVIPLPCSTTIGDGLEDDDVSEVLEDAESDVTASAPSAASNVGAERVKVHVDVEQSGGTDRAADIHVDTVIGSHGGGDDLRSGL